MTRHLRSFTARIAVSTMLAVSALTCATAWAVEPDVDTRSVSVSLTDIDMSSSAGRAVARARISLAANRACGSEFADLVSRAQVETCRVEAISMAQKDLDLKVAKLRPANDASVIVASR